jgi:tetratricopeptide (TPR) repeat protein
MKHFNVLVGIAISIVFSTVDANAQLNLPRGSQQASVSQTVGITKIQIDYSKPSVKGREIWGKLVPYGMNNLGFGTAKESPWRAGADENTVIHFSNDVTVEGQPLKAGDYGLHMIINENNKATIIFSNNSKAWGSFFYNPDKDALRVDVTTNSIPHTEQLTYDFIDVMPNSATAVLNWEKKQIPFKIGVDINKVVLEDIKNKLQNQEGFNRQTWENAAAYVLNNGGDYKEAEGWIDNAIGGQFYSQKTFNNLAIKAQLERKQGNNQEYTKIMDEAMGIATEAQLNALGYQMLNAKNYENALKYFKQAIIISPKSPNAFDSLGEYYATVGDKENAIKNFKKALSMNPPANVKLNSEKYLKQLGAM